MKKRILSAVCVTVCLMFAASIPSHVQAFDRTDSDETYTFSFARMGIPNEIYEYMVANGMDFMSNQDLMRASLATGISAGTGEPLTAEGRRQIEAFLGISSSNPAPAAASLSGGQAAKPAAPEHEHEYSEEITKEPACEEAGEKTFICAGCGDTYTEEVAALGHDYSEELTKEPTCTAEGESTYTCTRCGDSYTEAVPAAGHTYADVPTVDKEATCTTAGESSRHCTICDERTEIEEIPAKGHEKSGTYEVVTVATMFAAGEEVMKCAVCGEVIATRVIPQDLQSLYILIGCIAALVVLAVAAVVIVRKKGKKTAGAGKDA